MQQRPPTSLKIIKSSKFEDGTYAIKAPVHPLPMIELEEDGTPVADPQHAAAAAESRAVLERARQEALDAIAEAEAAIAQKEQEMLERVAAESERAHTAARSEGFALGQAEGRDAGQAAVLDEHAAELKRLSDGVEAAALARNSWFESQQKDLIKLSLLIAQKILGVELATSRDAIVKMAETALQHVTDKTYVRLRAHPADLPRLNAARGQLLLSADNLSALEIVGDPNVGLGGCMIDTRTGMVDARLSTQLAEIAVALLDIAPGADGASDLDPTVLAAVRALGQGGHVLSSGPQASQQQATGWQKPTAAPEAPPSPPFAMEARVPVAPASPEAAPPSVQAPTMEPVASQPMPPAAEAEVPTHAPSPEPEVAPALASGLELELEQAAPPLPEPVAVEAPAPAVAPPARAHDPSRRAADALAARLGQLKRGRGVVTLAEELDISQIEGKLTDTELASIVASTSRALPVTSIGKDEVLVHNPNAALDAADALAERLGQPKKRRPGSPEERALAEAMDAALADNRIDDILAKLLPSIRPEAEPASVEPANLESASENLAKLLGKNKRKSNRAWYDQ